MRCHCLFFLFALSLRFLANADEYKPPTPSANVAIIRETWRDAERERDVPVKIFLPEKSGSAQPVIIFSHGLGGTRETYDYLGEHWAGCGYVSVHLQHAGSDDAVWRNGGMEGMRKAVLDVRNAIDRV